MTRTERIHLLRQRAARSDEMTEAHRRCLATSLRLRKIGGYTSEAAAERAVSEGATRVMQTRIAADAARAELAAMLADEPEEPAPDEPAIAAAI